MKGKKVLHKNIFVLMFLLASVSCSSESKQNDKFVEIEFNVDNKLLSDKSKIVDGNFDIHYPEGFNSIVGNNFNRIKATIDSDSTSYFPLSLLSIHNTVSGSSSILSKIQATSEVFNKLDSNYTKLLSKNFNTKNINQSHIKINGIKTIQYIITTNEIVLLKLIFKVMENYYQLDYIIPLTEYEKELKSIESSIGSIIKKTEVKR